MQTLSMWFVGRDTFWFALTFSLRKETESQEKATNLQICQLIWTTLNYSVKNPLAC